MGERNQPHDTNVPLDWRLPVAQVVEILRQRLLGPAGHEIYVENPKSALYPQIPLAPAELFSPD
jgi:hypothetical protein